VTGVQTCALPISAVASRSIHYTVLPPDTVYQGKTYADYLAEYWNWIYSINCDANNIGDVFFCRGVEFPEPPLKAYARGPVVMVGDNGLNISENQAVFLAVMTSNAEAVGDRASFIDRDLRAQCTLDLNAAGVPNKKQILIDGNPIVLPADIDRFRTVTREYVLNVPSSEYGSTLAPYLDIVLDPGDYRCVAAGYCFLLQFERGEHTIYSIARGKPWKEGDYISELLYEVNVTPGDISPTRVPTPTFKLSNQIYTKIDKLEEKKEISSPKSTFLKNVIKARNRI
jgi:hypothetical protein